MIRIQDAQKHTDPDTDPDSHYCFEGREEDQNQAPVQYILYILQ
jgi:hypothetical protein